ncbi:MAG: head fiber protein [Bacteroidales bacterium]|jgi:hypothetical protein|nr:head fiber protein [Bacteroidales bacterium]
MAAGFTYNLVPEKEKEERYDVQSGIRRRGAYKLDTSNLTVGNYLPSFTPIEADLVAKTAVPVRNVKVVEAYNTGDNALTIKIEKNSLAYAGMFVGNGSHGALVNSIDKSNDDYDILTINAAFGANLAIGKVLFESAAVGGTTAKHTANSALYGRKKIESGIVLVALLQRAFEIEPDKLVLPFSDKDKANLPFFQFNE